MFAVNVNTVQTKQYNKILLYQNNTAGFMRYYNVLIHVVV